MFKRPRLEETPLARTASAALSLALWGLMAAAVLEPLSASAFAGPRRPGGGAQRPGLSVTKGQPRRVSGASEPAPRGATVGGASADAIVRRFEASFRDVRTLRADFTQTSYAWGQSRVESGTVQLARGGKMRWDYRNPESKLFISDGKNLVLYVPAEKQMTQSPISAGEDERVPLSLLLSHIDLHKVFSKIEFAGQALDAAPRDVVLRAFPKKKFSEDYRSVLIELTPSLDVRKLVVLYPDNSTMQFAFSHVERNVPLDPSAFRFAPPAGTAVIQQ